MPHDIKIDDIESLLKPGDALLMIDVQKDFCPGGALPVEGGNAIVPVINRWIQAAVAKGVPIYASRDWHPVGHLSFHEQGGPWPPHCIQDSDGATFHPDLALPDSAVIVTKGVRFEQDQNSAFDQTGLAVQLRKTGIRRLWVAGLAEDVCVLASVLDARREGFEVMLLQQATRPITDERGADAKRQMQDAGAHLVI